MLRKTILLGFFIPFVAFSTAVRFSISDNISLKPKTAAFNISIEEKGSSPDEVLQKLGKAKKDIAEKDLSYKGGYYNIFKNCYFDKGKNVCDGYKGVLSYVFYAKDNLEANKIFKALYQKNYSVNSIVLEPSKKDEEKAQKELYVRVINKVEDLKNLFSESLKQNCDIKSIDFIPYFRRPIVMPFSATKEEVPFLPKETISLKKEANVLLNCNIIKK